MAEFIYSNGVMMINLVEDTYLDIEFVPNDKGGFEDGKYSNMIKVDMVKKGIYTPNCLVRPHDIDETELEQAWESVKVFVKKLPPSYTLEHLENNIDCIIGVEFEGVYWEVDYYNRKDETDEGRANLMCFTREDVYLIDKPELEFKRIYLDELLHCPVIVSKVLE